MLFTSKSNLIIRLLTFHVDVVSFEIPKAFISNLLVTVLIITLILIVRRVVYEKAIICTIYKTIRNVSLIFSGITILGLILNLDCFFN